jgi:hypothetical protein
MLRCPIYNSTNACDVHSDCLFLRNGGCSLVLSATIAEENREKLRTLETRLFDLDYKLNSIINILNSK